MGVGGWGRTTGTGAPDGAAAGARCDGGGDGEADARTAPSGRTGTPFAAPGPAARGPCGRGPRPVARCTAGRAAAPAPPVPKDGGPGVPAAAGGRWSVRERRTRPSRPLPAVGAGAVRAGDGAGVPGTSGVRTGGVSRRHEGVTTGRAAPGAGAGAEKPSVAPVLTSSGRSARSDRERWTTAGAGAPPAPGSTEGVLRATTGVDPDAAETCGARVPGTGGRGAAAVGPPGGSGSRPAGCSRPGAVPVRRTTVPSRPARRTAVGAGAESPGAGGPSDARTGIPAPVPGRGGSGTERRPVPGPPSRTGAGVLAGSVRRCTCRPVPSSGAAPGVVGAAPAVGGSAASGAPIPPRARDGSAGVPGRDGGVGEASELRRPVRAGDAGGDGGDAESRGPGPSPVRADPRGAAGAGAGAGVEPEGTDRWRTGMAGPPGSGVPGPGPAGRLCGATGEALGGSSRKGSPRAGRTASGRGAVAPGRCSPRSGPLRGAGGAETRSAASARGAGPAPRVRSADAGRAATWRRAITGRRATTSGGGGRGGFPAVPLPGPRTSLRTGRRGVEGASLHERQGRCGRCGGHG